MATGTERQDQTDFVIDQSWESYTSAEHAVWRTLFERQAKLLPGRVCPEYLQGLEGLSVAADGIPDFRRLNDVLMKATGWQVVAVPGLIPDREFYQLLSERKFPAGNFIRRPDQLDYLEEPDVFHDVFGHVPLLMDPVFADYVQAYGKGGLVRERQGRVHFMARLYWYTVEFGLIDTPDGLRIYGAGIVSSRTESVFSVESPSPNRIGFNLARVMQARYRIDDFQQTYFVVDSFAQLFELASIDFTPILANLERQPTLDPSTVLPTDRVFARGTGAYHKEKRRAAA